MRYVEFYGSVDEDSSSIFYKGIPTQELIEELQLDENSKFYDGSGSTYSTTTGRMGTLGWKLEFVAPMGVIPGPESRRNGYINNLYIFSKEEDPQDWFKDTEYEASPAESEIKPEVKPEKEESKEPDKVYRKFNTSRFKWKKDGMDDGIKLTGDTYLMKEDINSGEIYGNT